jgi:zinc protease
MKNYQQVLHLIDEKMKKIREEPVSDGELERGKNMVLTMHELGRETIAAQAYEAALSEVLGLGFDWGERYRELVLGVDREDILRVAQQCFRYHLVVSTIPREPVETIIPPEQRERMHVQ